MDPFPTAVAATVARVTTRVVTRATTLVIARVAPLALCLAAPFGWGVAAAQSLEVTAGEAGRVSIRAAGARAADVAEALGQRTGISIVVTGDAGTPVDVDIVDEPLEKAVAQLAPNHLLMRAGKTPGSTITEIVLMMPDGDDGGVESTEFLPTGEPTDGIVTDDGSFAEGDGAVDENGMPLDQGVQILRDPDRAAAVRAAAAAAVAAQAAAQAAQLSGGGQEGVIDDGSGIDPATGLPFDDGQGIDPATGESMIVR